MNHARIALAALLSLSFAAGGAGVAGAREKEKSSKSKKSREREREPQTPPSLTLESVDLNTARAIVRVGGVTKAPDYRLFVFHDDRDRHFIALQARCEAVSVDESADDPEGTRSEGAREEQRCELEIPRVYLEKGSVIGMTVHLRGREVEADGESVRREFARAHKLVASRAGALVTVAPPATVPDGGRPVDRAIDNAPPPPDDPGIDLPEPAAGPVLSRPSQNGDDDEADSDDAE